MNKLLLGASLCVAIGISANVSNAASVGQLASAEGLLENNQPEAALSLLQRSHDPENASTQEFFLLGLSAKLSGKLEEAERYFRGAVGQEPNAGRIRLELAEVLFRLRKLDASRAELVTVRNSNPPEQVRQNIDTFIAQVDAAKANPQNLAQGPRKSWNAYITAGMTSDSNINAGPDTDTVFLYGLPFTLSNDAKQTKDTLAFLRVGGNHAKQLNENTVWRTSGSLGISNYFGGNTYDTVSLNASSGPSFRAGKKIELAVPLTYDVQRYNSQGSWYSQSVGIEPRVQYNVRDNLQVYVDGSIARKRFKDDSSRDLTAIALKPAINYQPHENGNIAVGVQLGKENSGQDIYSNTVRGAYIGYQHIFREQNIRANVTLSYTDTKFKGVQAAYTEARHDKSKKVSVGLSYTLPQMDGLTLDGSISYQDNQSNLGINNYDRTQITVSVTKQF